MVWPVDEERVAVEIPASINHLRSQGLAQALAWRLATRQVFHVLFSAGYVVDGFVRSQDVPVRCWYILRSAT